MRFNMKKLSILILLILACCVLLISCTKSSIYYQANISKVVELLAYDEEEIVSNGTGWFISDDIVVTNYHVISSTKYNETNALDNIKLRFYDQDDYEKLDLINYKEVKDIAFLKYEGSHKHFKFELQFDYNVSDLCYCIGNFMNYGLSYKEGYISLKTVKLLYNAVNQEFIQCGINIGQGDSGAPVFNNKNEIIGMVTLRVKNSSGIIEQGFAYLIPSKVISDIYSSV